MATTNNTGSGDARHALGAAAEHAAAQGLTAQGLEILQRNWRRRSGELDIIARERDVLVIVEVRMRSQDDYGGAAASVDAKKCRRIVRTTQQLLQQQPGLRKFPVRFDVIAARPITKAVRPDAPCHAKTALSQHGIRWLHDPQGNFELQWIRHAFAADR